MRLINKKVVYKIQCCNWLPTLQELGDQVPLVCKRWRELCYDDDVWNTLDLYKYKNIKVNRRTYKNKVQRTTQMCDSIKLKAKRMGYVV